ncbi:hypothetical protein ACWEIJ_43975 [Lentzea sp. NPDC004789]
MAGAGYTAIALTPLPRKPTGSAVTGAWRYLVGCHSSVTGLFDALATVRATKQATTGQDTRGRLASDEEDLLRAALVFTSSGLDACCKRLLPDTLESLIAGNATAGRKFHDFIKQELATGPSDPLAQAILASDPRKQMIKAYIDVRTKASMQGSGDVKTRVRDTLGISNAQLPVAQIETLDKFFAARNAIVHNLDYEDPSAPNSKARWRRKMEEVRDDCDAVLAVVATIIRAAATNLRACP